MSLVKKNLLYLLKQSIVKKIIFSSKGFIWKNTKFIKTFPIIFNEGNTVTGIIIITSSNWLAQDIPEKSIRRDFMIQNCNRKRLDEDDRQGLEGIQQPTEAPFVTMRAF